MLSIRLLTIHTNLRLAVGKNASSLCIDILANLALKKQTYLFCGEKR